MSNKEVSRKGWQTFCERIQQSHHGALISIELTTPDGRTETLARNMPLQSIALDETTDACNDQVVIEAGAPGERTMRHIVIEPIHLRLQNSEDSRYHRLNISAENGVTNIFFHPGLRDDLIQDLAA
jgi:hypothetical protein